ncbi:MAG: radical SAM protein, partial [Candidatus Margulisiibacteriota bacterium]
MFTQIQTEVKKIRSLFPRATIVLGGAGVNTVKDLLQLKAFFPEVNALVKGDGEKVFCRLLECLKDGQIDTIKMEALAVKGVYVSVEGREYLDNRANVLSGEELNELPALTAFPDLVKDIKRRGCLELHTSRGCKYRCVFCSHKYHDRPIYWSADRLLQELREIKKKIQRKELPKEARNIYFSDDDFFQDKERAIRFLTLSSADPAIRTFFKYSFQGAIGSFLSRGKVDRQLLGLLKQVKIGWLNLGTDGFSDKMLRLLGKSGYNWRQAKEVMVAVDISGIPHCHYLILTHPQMDEQMFFEQLNNLIIVLSHNPNMRIHVNETITAYEGTILMEKAKQFIPDRLQTLDGVRGERKYLPIHLPLSQDGYLNLAIMKTLRQPFKTVSQLIEDRKAQIKKGADFQKVAKLTAKMIRWRRKQPVGLTVLDAINWEHRFVVFTALRFLLEETA